MEAIALLSSLAPSSSMLFELNYIIIILLFNNSYHKNKGNDDYDYEE